MLGVAASPVSIQSIQTALHTQVCSTKVFPAPVHWTRKLTNMPCVMHEALSRNMLLAAAGLTPVRLTLSS